MGMYDSAGISAQFMEIGEFLEGEVLSFSVREDTDMDTGVKKTWNDGSTVEIGVWEIDAGASGKWEKNKKGTYVKVDVPDDDGVRTIWARGGIHTAIKAAVRDSRIKQEDFVGCRLRVELVDTVFTDEARRKGWSPRKIFKAKLTPGKPKSDGMYDKGSGDTDFDV